MAWQEDCARSCLNKINGTYEGGVYLNGGFFSRRRKGARKGRKASPERNTFPALTTWKKKSKCISVNSQEHDPLHSDTYST